MSHRATNWAIQQRGLPPAAKIVLWHLADRHNPDLGCFPTQAKLSEDCEMSRSSLNNQLALLEERGLILREQRKDGSQRQAATWYRFAFEPEFEALKAAQEPAETTETDESRVQNLDTEPCPIIGPSRVQNSGTSESNCLDTEPVSEPVIEPLPPTPLTEGAEPAGGERDVDQDSEDQKKAEQCLKRSWWKLVNGWPNLNGLPTEKAKQVFASMSEQDRETAIAKRDAWFALLKQQKRDYVPAPATYLRERLFDAVSDAVSLPVAGVDLPPYGKGWMAWRLQLLATMPARPWQPTAGQRAIISAGKEHLVADARRHAKYPLVHALDIDAESGLGRRAKAGEDAPLAVSFVRIKRGSNEWQAWEQWHHERDWPWINPPKHVEWVFVPSSMPSAGEATGAEQAA
jgi:hypothetical protein